MIDHNWYKYISVARLAFCEKIVIILRHYVLEYCIAFIFVQDTQWSRTMHSEADRIACIVEDGLAAFATGHYDAAQQHAAAAHAIAPERDDVIALYVLCTC